MSVYDDVLAAVISLAEETKPYASIVIGAVPPADGISIAWTDGFPLSVFRNKNAVMDMTASLNGKHTDHSVVSDALGCIHEALSRRQQYPESEKWQIIDISTKKAPHPISEEQTDQCLYGSSLRVKFYLRGD